MMLARHLKSLVEKVAQSKQLMAVADPEIVILFESWLDELEQEVIEYIKDNDSAEAIDLASEPGLSIPDQLSQQYRRYQDHHHRGKSEQRSLIRENHPRTVLSLEG